ncbi:MAG: helix-turn-helix domain-containing protein [Candidatus Shapirobacteria bacterium]|jgi:hypothetical protein
MALLPPLSPDSLLNRFGPIFSSTNRGLSVKLFGLPGSGKSATLSWILNHPEALAVLTPKSSRCHYLIDLENPPQDQEIQKFISDSTHLPLTIVVDSANLLSAHRSLEQLLASNYHQRRPDLSFIFLFNSFIPNELLAVQSPLLKTPLLEASSFFKFFDQLETVFTMNQWQQILDTRFPRSTFNFISVQSGGLAVLIKTLCLLFHDNPRLPLDSESLSLVPDIGSIFARLLSALPDHQKRLLLPFTTKPQLIDTSPDFKILENFGLISGQGSSSKLFSPIFTCYLAHHQSPQQEIHGFKFSLPLTPGEQSLFNCLYDHLGRIVSRDQVGQAIWHQNWQQKYSDWALDQIVSQLRKKFSSDSDRQRFVTHRGQGFCLLASE